MLRDCAIWVWCGVTIWVVRIYLKLTEANA